MLVEVLNSLKAQLVIGPPVVADSDCPGWWNSSMVPGALVKLAIKDDK